LKILHIRKSGIDMEGYKRRSRGTSFWDLDSDEDSSIDKELGLDFDPDVITGSDGSSNVSTSNSGKPLSSTYSTASLDSLENAEI
jgi:hypothetical protein